MPSTFERSALLLKHPGQRASWSPPGGTLAAAARSPVGAGGLWWTVVGLDVAPWWYLLSGLLADAGDNALRIAASWQQAAIDRRARIRQSVGGSAKRALDIAVATTAIVLLLPVMLLVALLLWMQSGGPVLISHPRVGYGGRLFGCLKFRSMIVNADAALQRHLASDPEAAREWRETQKLRNDPRVTPFGHFLRKTSLDELPQLFNVLRGDMSCVGPRPIVPDELRRYGRQARYYLRSRPGLTGIWQVSGRSSTSYRRRVAMDTYYVQHWSLGRDAQLLVMTLPAMLKTGDAV